MNDILPLVAPEIRAAGKDRPRQIGRIDHPLPQRMKRPRHGQAEQRGRQQREADEQQTVGDET